MSEAVGATEIEPFLTSLKELGVRLDGLEEVRQYLLEFPDMIEVLTRTVGAVLEYLPGYELFLEVCLDPEIDDRYLNLALCIQNQQLGDSILEWIEAIEGEILASIDNKEGWLQLSIL